MTRRAGVASLEFVLCMPFMLALFAFLASVGFASLEKAGVAIAVRNDAWKKREDKNAQRIETDRPLSAVSSITPLAGGIYEEAKKEVKVFDWLKQSPTAISGTAVLGGAWDHTQIDDFEKLPKGPHFSLIERVAGGDGAVTREFTQLLTILLTGLPNQDEVNGAQKEKEKAEAKAREEREKIEAEIRKLRGELKILEDERAELMRTRDAKQRELNELIGKQGSEARVRQLRDEIADLDAKIRQKNVEIEAKKVEIRRWEDALRRLNEESGKLPS